MDRATDMRHKKSGRHLNRTSAHRKAMFANMAVSLIEHEIIKTTVPKAKELRRLAEPLITLAKIDSVANRRLAFSRIRDKAAVAKLFVELGPRYEDRPGGYTRILKSGYRPGDTAPLAFIELVGRPVDTEEFDGVDDEIVESSDDVQRSGDAVENNEELGSESVAKSEEGDGPKMGSDNQEPHIDSETDQKTDETDRQK